MFYRELLQLVCKMSNLLESYGVKRGDRVAIYLPKSPTAVAAMLACARIGAVHSVVFAGFSSEALAGRILDGMYTVPPLISCVWGPWKGQQPASFWCMSDVLHFIQVRQLLGVHLCGYTYFWNTSDIFSAYNLSKIGCVHQM